MPNWTANTIAVRGNKDKLNSFKRKVEGENGAFDFNRIVPMPKNSKHFLADGPSGQEEKQKFGENNWYDWSIKHWGTKWNACYIETDEDKESLAYHFYTAWDAPRPLVEPITALAQELDLSIAWEAEHEDGGYEPIVDTEDLS